MKMYFLQAAASTQPIWIYTFLRHDFRYIDKLLSFIALNHQLLGLRPDPPGLPCWKTSFLQAFSN